MSTIREIASEMAEKYGDFADESEYMNDDGAWDEPPDDRSDVAEMIADFFGRSVMDCDYQLADSIIFRLSPKP